MTYIPYNNGENYEWHLANCINVQNFPVEELVLKHKDEQGIVDRVKTGQLYCRKDVCFIVRIAAKYLMSKCSVWVLQFADN